MTKPVKDQLPVPYSFGNVLKKYREKSGIGQGELAISLGVNKNTVYNWENDKSRPDVDMIRVLCQKLHIPIQEWFNICDKEPQFDDDELKLIKNIRSMSERMRYMTFQTVQRVAEEDRRLQEKEQRQKEEELRRSYYVMGLESTWVAAGQGDGYSQIEHPHRCFVKVSPASTKADRMVRVSGPSMEPVYYDGDIVYVADATANDVYEGQDVICSTNQGPVIKRMGKGGKPYSVNSKYPFKLTSGDYDVRVIGRVVGTVEKGDIATGDLVETLDDLLQDDVNEFYEKNGRD